MGLYIVVKEGPRAGDEFKISEGLVVGRSKGDITLRDSKVSSNHAKIMRGPDGHLYLVDNESANGIWINDQQVSRVKLESGALFRVGESLLEVVEEFAAELPENERDSWQGQLWGFFKSAAESPSLSKPKKPHIFEPCVTLTFTKGIQSGESWVLGYGPRLAGAGTHDLYIEDLLALEFCFEIKPDENGKAHFSTPRPDRVKLNDSAKESEKLKEGDIISFGDNEILVSFKN